MHLYKVDHILVIYIAFEFVFIVQKKSIQVYRLDKSKTFSKDEHL